MLAEDKNTSTIFTCLYNQHPSSGNISVFVITKYSIDSIVFLFIISQYNAIYRYKAALVVVQLYQEFIINKRVSLLRIYYELLVIFL